MKPNVGCLPSIATAWIRRMGHRPFFTSVGPEGVSRVSKSLPSSPVPQSYRSRGKQRGRHVRAGFGTSWASESIHPWRRIRNRSRQLPLSGCGPSFRLSPRSSTNRPELLSWCTSSSESGRAPGRHPSRPTRERPMQEVFSFHLLLRLALVSSPIPSDTRRSVPHRWTEPSEIGKGESLLSRLSEAVDCRCRGRKKLNGKQRRDDGLGRCVLRRVLTEPRRTRRVRVLRISWTLI